MLVSILSGHTKHPDSNNKCTSLFCNVVGNTLLIQLIHGYLALKPSNQSHLEIQTQRAALVMAWIHTQNQ